MDARAVPPSLPARSPALMPGDVLWGAGWAGKALWGAGWRCLEHPGLALREWVLEGLEAGESGKWVGDQETVRPAGVKTKPGASQRR